ncbi:hypothetical protein A2334_02965 [Candidatus Roizmanbacteria bacterium RIFOXYB2_FULL_38_10]|uniref:Methyltransferase n=1 Tax=Candidatus Roizmanbacteria bacterium RIFOXYD1_FULL_38_12 TaxID=1802093 RepID=A0A1F7L0D7_9BACT|nr:MAG: hypothetical protein A3K47_02035 [Candidatus Roizmanbacteria bacterium RIFOXYA2_FULL_38_14]OGK63558.1 MAG: hypothetical protein A3K27_02035 [Candidatus Roizmanbacteria bacterium RIFOXYA1_FULL_37_12]OGK65404.1 MAG: hypothetical protein A3K38_02035 [Candidatus Roizmanbacteria bacterium RIFOXYB1_FULL_40_23]OGK69119.1 MAG: hypothetical protein A2334_02965 [Candidatus Roizmanbacteria bacterium RIFOXYB2_FULL_38_10]OGK69809.1 MAG: hypothetical protein A3K21_02040 [Candidatus Roizmanbacteria ba
MKCLLCGHETDGVYRVVNEVKIYECRACGLGFVDQSKAIGKTLDHLYLFDMYKKQEGMIRKRLTNLVNKIVYFKSSGSVLEIGAGYGLLSSMLLQKGHYTLDVVEPSLIPHYLAKKKFTLHKTDLDGFLKKNKKKFDLIVMFDVIEHLPKPLESIKQLRKALKSEGVLVIQTPNYKSIMQYIVRDWSWWMVEDHKWFFSPDSLKKLLNEVGYKPLLLWTYEDWFDFKKNLDGNFVYITNTFIRKCTKTIFFTLFTPIYFLLRNLLWSSGEGGLIFSVSCRKKD